MHEYELIIYWSNDDSAFFIEAPELPGCVIVEAPELPGCVIVEAPELPGCVAHGQDIANTIKARFNFRP